MNEVYEVEAERCRPGPTTRGERVPRSKATRLETRAAGAARHRRRALARVADRRTRTCATGSASRSPTSSCRRCRRRRCSRTPTRRSGGGPGSRGTTSGSRRTRATSAGPRASTRTSTRAATACPRWTARTGRSRAPTSSCWYTFGVTHFVRPEDWPVMPVEYAGFLLTPFGFFDRNPALDVPPNDRALRRPERTDADGPMDTRRAATRRTTTTSRPRQEAGRTGDWRPWAELFTEDADVRRAPLRHVRRAARRSTTWITETMAQWPNSEMKEFPHDWCVCDEERGWWICQIENRFRRSRRRRDLRGLQPHRAEVRGRHAVLVRRGRVQPGELRAGREGLDRQRHDAARARRLRRASSRSTRRGCRPRAWRGTSRRRRRARIWSASSGRCTRTSADARGDRRGARRRGHGFRHRGR